MAVFENPADWPWSDDLDAVAAAPDSHLILLENERVSYLKVILEPGVKEPYHTHRWPSVFVLIQPAQIRYYDETGQVLFETNPEVNQKPEAVEWVAPEGLHAVENIDAAQYVAYRIELKQP